MDGHVWQALSELHDHGNGDLTVGVRPEFRRVAYGKGGYENAEQKTPGWTNNSSSLWLFQ